MSSSGPYSGVADRPPSAYVMVVDDEEANLRILKRLLGREGWRVVTFLTGEEALRSAAADPPDVVLLDVNMPGMDGHDVCRLFKAHDRLSRIPVIFLSGLSDSRDKLLAFEVGGADYITKPFSAMEVMARTRLQLELASYRQQLEHLVERRTEELSEAHRRLRVWDGARQQWLDTIAHELRTPLQGIFGIAELALSEVPETEATVRLAQAYARSRQRILKLVDDASTIASIDVGAKNFSETPQPLAPILRDAARAAAPFFPPGGIRVSLDDLGEDVCVLGEAPLLMRAFADLFLTARQCVREGEAVSLDVSIGNGEARIAFVTDGPSLPAEALDTFFEVGGQQALVRGGGDFGLAPALASRILQLFHGRTAVTNRMPGGIVIEVRLPLKSKS